MSLASKIQTALDSENLSIAEARALLAEALVRLAPKPKAMPDNDASYVASYFVAQIGTGRKLVTTPAKSAPAIKKLLKVVTKEEVMATIDWLVKENPKRKYPFVVLSGQALVDKWDRIREAMGPMTQPKRMEYF